MGIRTLGASWPSHRPKTRFLQPWRGHQLPIVILAWKPELPCACISEGLFLPPSTQTPMSLVAIHLLPHLYYGSCLFLAQQLQTAQAWWNQWNSLLSSGQTTPSPSLNAFQVWASLALSLCPRVPQSIFLVTCGYSFIIFNASLCSSSPFKPSVWFLHPPCIHTAAICVAAIPLTG